MQQAIKLANKQSIDYFYDMIVFSDEDQIADYLTIQIKRTTLGSILDSAEFMRNILHFVNYMYDLNFKKHIFHGDIKPENIFVSLKIHTLVQNIETDSGSLKVLHPQL